MGDPGVGVVWRGCEGKGGPVKGEGVLGEM